MSRRKIILIGGMPTVGKSTIAARVAKRLDLPWISTDQIRTLMMTTANKQDYPLLFNEDGHTAESYLTTYTADEIATQEIQQADEIWSTIRHFIDSDWVWRDGFVLEGINITPSLVAETYGGNEDIKAVFLSDSDTERTRTVVYKRGLFGPPHETPDALKEKEIEWTHLFDRTIREQIEKTGLPLVEIEKTERDVDRVLIALGYS